MSYVGVFELFKVGIGPSSSHTVGPMVAAYRFAGGLPGTVVRVRVELFGSLALTGRGHGTDQAVVMGLAGHEPATVGMDVVGTLWDRTANTRALRLANGVEIEFDVTSDIVFTSAFRPEHANVVEFTAFDAHGVAIADRSFASIGGGFVVEAGDHEAASVEAVPVPYPFDSATELVDRAGGGTIADVVRANELAFRDRAALDAGLDHIAGVMFESIDRGLRATGLLPGPLGVRRRARDLALDLAEHTVARSLPPSEPTDWAGVWAIAVNEENAAGHRIVTAPTNGAAGIVPAVLRFLTEHCKPTAEQPIHEYLLTAAAIGSLLKANAGISGAELGCQGEVGSACAMAAAGLTAALGGTPAQVENAAEIALEHNLGLTCDPVAGLVQVPCIERNAVGAVKAITAASLALRGDGTHVVSLDTAIETLRLTGMDMDRRYKETSLGGLAVTVALPDC